MNKKNQLSFATLSTANTLRLPQFRNSKGELAHSKPDGSDWSLAEWLEAVVGELGEYANFAKKYRRGDITLEEFRVKGGKELADTVTYLSILAAQVGVDLGKVTVDKFNEVSHRVGSTVFILESGKDIYLAENFE